MPIKRYFREYLMISIGCAILAAAISLFWQPHNLVTGGASGLGIIASFYSSLHLPFYIPVWLTNLAINIPLLLLGLKVFGIKFITKTIYGTLCLTASLFVTDRIPFVIESDLFLASIFGGVLAGLGMGIVFRNLGNTGGSDLAAQIIVHFKRHFSLSKVLMIVDWAVIGLGFFVFGSERTMYAIVSIFISTKAIDFVLEGLNFAKAVFIISDKSEKIGAALMEMNRGATSLHGTGVYTGKDKNVLLCVVSKREIVRVKDIVAQEDEAAFVVVADVREVLGEGFVAIK